MTEQESKKPLLELLSEVVKECEEHSEHWEGDNVTIDRNVFAILIKDIKEIQSKLEAIQKKVKGLDEFFDDLTDDVIDRLEEILKELGESK